ncbi:MAG: nucleoside-diphosphate kinase [Chloroflexota bacterium]|nr:MAG: nucleoside-diphosphate kinase [Chloroflexota bacterium]
MERTLVIIKPDGVQRGLIGDVLTRFERRGLKIVGLRLIKVDRMLAERHYAVHKGKSFYDGLVEYITSAPVVVFALEGPDAIQVTRRVVGATKSNEAAPGTIRGDLALTVGRNIIHASDSPETAAFELGLYFGAGDLIEYGKISDNWVFPG